MPPPPVPGAPDPLHQILSPEEAAELVQRAKNFEERALAQLYHLFADRVFRFMYYRIDDRPRAEELTNEVFVRILENVENFQMGRGDAALLLTSWVFTIARNLVIDDLRRRKRLTVEPLAEAEPELADERDDVELHITRTDLQAALSQLTEEQQTVLLLRFEEGFTSVQIAGMMGKTEMAIKALQRRGLATMARVLTGTVAHRDRVPGG